jgi:hypothetical protein
MDAEIGEGSSGELVDELAFGERMDLLIDARALEVTRQHAVGHPDQEPGREVGVGMSKLVSSGEEQLPHPLEHGGAGSANPRCEAVVIDGAPRCREVESAGLVVRASEQIDERGGDLADRGSLPTLRIEGDLRRRNGRRDVAGVEGVKERFLVGESSVEARHGAASGLADLDDGDLVEGPFVGEPLRCIEHGFQHALGTLLSGGANPIQTLGAFGWLGSRIRFAHDRDHNRNLGYGLDDEADREPGS